MTGVVSLYRRKHMKKSILEVRMLAETAVLDGQVVKIGATEGQVVPCGNNENPLGIALNGVTAADIAAYAAETVGVEAIEVMVMVIGIAPVLAGAEIDMNVWVRSDANGRVVPITGDGTDWPIGICYDAATGDGEATHILVDRIPATNRS